MSGGARASYPRQNSTAAAATRLSHPGHRPYPAAMRDQVEQHFGFLKTTLLGGVVFLLPLIVVGALLAQAGQIVWGIVDAVRREPGTMVALPAGAHSDWATPCSWSPRSGSLSADLLRCRGLVARRSIGRWFTGQAERYLTMLFPRYSVFKDQLTGNLGGEIARGRTAADPGEDRSR